VPAQGDYDDGEIGGIIVGENRRREERRLRVFENRVLRRIFVPKRD
jgi:hypothetical protein